MPIEILTVTKVTTAKPGRHCDGGGLWLFVGPNSKSWVFRYMIGGTARAMGLGSVDDLGLAAARDKARKLRKLVHRKPEDGGPIDPLNDRQAAEIAQRVEKVKEITFRGCAEAYLKANADSWKNQKHRQQWFNTLSTYVYPIIGELPVQAVDVGLVERVLAPIWHEKAETARRVRMRIETVLEWAIAARHYAGDNPARREIMKHLLGKQTDVVKHFEAVHYDKIGDFIANLRAHEGLRAEALEFLILNCTRTTETLLADWSEIDFSKRLWNIPRLHRKGPKNKEMPLTVPLSDRAIEILAEIRDRTAGAGLVFRNGTKRLSENALLNTMEQLGAAATTHGFRSTFSDWAGERANYPREVREAALGHIIKDKVEAAYRREVALGTAFLEKRRPLMAEWAQYCDTPSAPAGDNVVPIGTVRSA